MRKNLSQGSHKKKTSQKVKKKSIIFLTSLPPLDNVDNLEFGKKFEKYITNGLSIFILDLCPYSVFS